MEAANQRTKLPRNKEGTKGESSNEEEDVSALQALILKRKKTWTVFSTTSRPVCGAETFCSPGGSGKKRKAEHS